MKNWKSLLLNDPTEWLLEEENPSVRYFTLRDLSGKSQSDAKLQTAKAEIMNRGLVPAILKKQNEDGAWEAPGRFYTAKYRGSVWQLILLAELGADGRNDQIRRGCEYLLRHSQERESGGFAMKTAARTGGGLRSEVIPCLTGNMLWSLIQLGYLEDPRIQSGIDWIVRYQRFDDGIDVAPSGWPYDRFEICWGKHTCLMGVVKNLKALSAIPADQRSMKVQSVMRTAVEFLLIHHIYKRSHNLDRVSKPGWLKPGFPLMYQTDILEILGILTDLGTRDDRMTEAIDLLRSKQDHQGRWIMENSYNDRLLMSVEEKGKPSKWITLKAMKVLKKWYGNL